MKEEEYTLEIKNEGILVQGEAIKESCNEVQTLRQIFRQEGGVFKCFVYS